MSAPWIARIGPLTNRVNPRIASFVFEIPTPDLVVDAALRDDCECWPRLVDHPVDVTGDTVLVSLRDQGKLAQWGGDFLDERARQLKGAWAERLSNADAWRVTVQPDVSIAPIYWAEEVEDLGGLVPLRRDGLDAS